MNVLLWIIQILLALLSIAGGAYKIFEFDELAKMPATAGMARSVWAALGAFEMVCGILLVIPAAKRRWTPLAATALAVESLALAVFYARYSLEVTATNPLVWAVAMVLMALIVAWGRFAKSAS
jgi:uncharacterized membrane protein YphA (DoxX/SURF4 family)